MAGYQNKKGYSGSDVDLILYDHAQKAAPIQAIVSIDIENWDGTETTTGKLKFVTDFPSDFPYSKFCYNGTNITFQLLNQSIIAQVIAQKTSLGSDIDTANAGHIFFNIMFIAHDTDTDFTYRLYFMSINFNAKAASGSEFPIKIVPMF